MNDALHPPVGNHFASEPWRIFDKTQGNVNKSQGQLCQYKTNKIVLCIHVSRKGVHAIMQYSIELQKEVPQCDENRLLTILFFVSQAAPPFPKRPTTSSARAWAAPWCRATGWPRRAHARPSPSSTSCPRRPWARPTRGCRSSSSTGRRETTGWRTSPGPGERLSSEEMLWPKGKEGLNKF